MAFTVAAAHAAGYNTTTSTYAGPVPASIAENNLIFAQVVANTSNADAITPPAGWTVLWDNGSGAFVVSGSCGIYVAYHLVTAAEAATPPASWDFGLGTARAGNIIITRVTGHNPADVLDTAISTDVGSFSDATPLTCAALTSTVANALAIGGCVVQSASSRTITEPSGWTQDDTTCGLDYGRGADIAHLVLGSAGSTGAVDWYQSGSSLSGAAWMVVVAPAVSAPPHAIARNSNRVWRIHG